VVPVPALYVLDSEHDRPETYDAWLASGRPVVRAVLAPPLLEGV
jgi:hypothetical protein